MRVAFLQDGARLRFAVPLALQRAGVLDCAFIDWYVRSSSSWSGRVANLLNRLHPATGKRVMGRSCPELECHRVRSSPLFGLKQKIMANRMADRGDYYAWVRSHNARRIGRQGFGQADVFAGFIRSLPPDLCEEARRRGLKTVGDQIIAPVATEREEAAIQAQRWPGWEPLRDTSSYDREEALEQATWPHLNHLTCASTYVRDSLIRQGISSQKVTVLPYPVDATHLQTIDRAGRRGPVTVGFVGAVNLRKGVPYFLQVAKRLASANLRFVMVGPIHLNRALVEEYRDVVNFVGKVALSEIPGWLERFDMILFPSTCEGSAGALMEAMATGLPVVASPNSGTIAADGCEGYLVPYDDIDGLADRVEQLALDAPRRIAMGMAARHRVEACGITEYGREWVAQVGAHLDRA